MYEMAKKAREAMRGKAKRLSGEKDSKVDSSNWTPSEPLNADVQTGMRPISKRAYKKGGKVEGDKTMTHAGRKPRKSGGRAITADSLINRDQKEANEGREGKKHVGALKTGGRAGHALGGAPTDVLKSVRAQTMGFKKGGVAKKAGGGEMSAADQARAAAAAAAAARQRAQDARTEAEREDPRNQKRGGRAQRKAGGNVNYGPMEMPAGKKGMSTSEQIAEEKKQDAASKPKRGKAGHYDYGGTVPMQPAGPDPRMNIVDKNKMGGAFQAGSPYKKGGMAKWEGSAKDEAQDKKLAKKHGMSMKEWEASSFDKKHDKQQSPKGLKSGGEAKKWIAGAIGKKGALHKALHVPQGEKIPEKKLEKAEASDNPKLAKRARLAETLKGFHRTAKFGGGALSDLNMGPAKAAGGPAKGKGRTNINIMINPGAAKPDDQMAGMPGMPPGMPPRPPGGVPVPMGMPPAGGVPPAPMPMPMPMPMPPGAGGGMPPMGRKAGGKVYRSYKDMDAGSGGGLGRLEKTEIQKRKA